jgi:hypothetical protein
VGVVHLGIIYQIQNSQKLQELIMTQREKAMMQVKDIMQKEDLVNYPQTKDLWVFLAIIYKKK